MKWYPIPGHEGYEITRDGRVRSTDRTIVDRLGRSRQLKGLELVPTLSRGYYCVSLGPARMRKVHRLVLETFVGPANGRIARHLNGDRYDNRADNLAWGTYAENTQDTLAHGTHASQRQTECKNGHPLEGDNLARSARGRRVCRTCHNARNRRYNALRKAQTAPSPAQT